MTGLSIEAIEGQLVREIAAIRDVAPSTIDPEAPLHTLGIDSLSFVEILVFIEKTFRLRLLESGLSREHFQTVRSIARSIAQATGHTEGAA